MRKLTTFSGLFWIITDVLWFYGFTQIAIVTGIITLVLTFLLFFVNNDNHFNVVLTTWVILNLCFLVSDHNKLNTHIVILCRYVVTVALVCALPSMVRLVFSGNLKHLKKL